MNRNIFSVVLGLGSSNNNNNILKGTATTAIDAAATAAATASSSNYAKTDIEAASNDLLTSKNVIIVPGYGLAVAKVYYDSISCIYYENCYKYLYIKNLVPFF